MHLPSIDIRDLALLVALDEEGTLNAAASRLHRTPSALSQRLSKLEDRLEGPLFERSQRRLVVTAAGRHLTERARSVLDELIRIEVETRDLLNGVRGTIRIATACHHSYRWLPALLRSFAQTNPGVEVTVVSEAVAAPCQWIAARKLDIALVTGEADQEARVHLEPLFRDELVALVGKEHAWFGRSAVDIRMLADEHVWVGDGALGHDTPLGRALDDAVGINPRKVTSISMTAGVPLEIARAHLGITFMPRWTVEPALTEGDLSAVRLGSEGVWLDWSVATRAERAGPALEAFLAALRTHHPRARTHT